MDKYLEQLFLKKIEFDEYVLCDNLFISFDNTSALRADYKKVVSLIKINDSYKIIKSNIRTLKEGYEQGLFIIEGNRNYFLRLILSDNKIYDALIYTIKDMDFINRVFFNFKDYSIPERFKNSLELEKNVLILKKEDSLYRIIKGNKHFYNTIKYEDWDFENKYQNVLNQKLASEIVDFNNLKLYRSDNEIVTISFLVECIDDIYCLVEK